MAQRVVTFLMLLMISFGVPAREIRYASITGINEGTLGYSVLKLALEKTNSDYRLAVNNSDTAITPARLRIMLESGQLDVTDGGYNPEFAKTFEPIYLPMDMGLSGWRIFVLRKDTYATMNPVQKIEDLKPYVFGQGEGWYDTEILQNAQLTVLTAPKISNLFGMLKVGRFDLLPLGASEAHELLKTYGSDFDDLVIDDNIALIYPFGRFFYLRTTDVELRKTIQIGMEKALSDGSLLALLKSNPFSRDAFERANLKQRVQIHIATPDLTEGFRSIDPKWWYSP